MTEPINFWSKGKEAKNKEENKKDKKRRGKLRSSSRERGRPGLMERGERKHDEGNRKSGSLEGKGGKGERRKKMEMKNNWKVEG